MIDAFITGPDPSIDGTDFEILELLSLDARRTLADIAQRVSFSAPAVKRRVRRLERLGVITGYTVEIDHSRLGQPIEAFTELRFAGNTKVAEIAGVGRGVPEVQAIYTTAGDPDALVRIRARDVADLTRVIDLLRRSGQVMAPRR